MLASDSYGYRRALKHTAEMSKNQRLCIYPKDIEIILDLSPRQAYRRYQFVKDVHNKAKHQELTFREFGEYYGLPLEDVYQKLKT